VRGKGGKNRRFIPNGSEKLGLEALEELKSRQNSLFQSFGGNCYLHLQVIRVSPAGKIRNRRRKRC
jgi:hypothetical protein